MSMTKKDDLTAGAILADICAGRRSVAEIAEATIAAIALREPELRAFAHFDPARLRAEAAALDRRPPGPLQGVTVGVKDMIHVRDMPTAYNTLRYAGVVRPADAACVDLLRGAGGLIVGKTTMPEFASTHRGPGTRNPHDPARSAGGSSTGSAVAVAAGLCAIGVGTQTGGSVIRPASYNGVFGWKPSWTVIPTEGCLTMAPTFDAIGFFARRAEDFEPLAEVFALDAAPEPEGLEGLRVGVCRTPLWSRAEPATRAAMADAEACLRAAGARVQPLPLPEVFDGLPAALDAIMAREMRVAFLNEVAGTPGLHPDFAEWIARGDGVPPETARAAYALADRCRAAMDGLIAGHDIVLAPSATGEAPLGTHTGDSALNGFWTLMQTPVVSASGLVGPVGMPVGVSLIARRYQDRTCIAVARLLAPRLAAFRRVAAAEG